MKNLRYKNMKSSRYKTLLRTLYGAVLASRLSALDLKALSEELRQGQLSSELAYMIDAVLVHLEGSDSEEASKSEPNDELMVKAEYLIRHRRIPKKVLANIMASLGLPLLSRDESVRDMLGRFMHTVSLSQAVNFLEILESLKGGDEFLAGISGTRT